MCSALFGLVNKMNLGFLEPLKAKGDDICCFLVKAGGQNCFKYIQKKRQSGGVGTWEFWQK